jgi:histidine ammonia-lyase
LKEAHALLRKQVAAMARDRLMAPGIERGANLERNGSVAQALQKRYLAVLWDL